MRGTQGQALQVENSPCKGSEVGLCLVSLSEEASVE